MTGRDARFAELYDGFYRKVLVYCRRRTKPELVDDAVAETFLTAWKKIDEVPNGSDALPWLYAVAYRAIGHQYRASGRHHKLRERLSTLGMATPPNDSAELVVMNHDSRQVVHALSKLRPSDQELLRLLVWEELSSSEIATVLGISEAAAKKRCTRAKTALVRSYRSIETRTSSPAAQEGGAW